MGERRLDAKPAAEGATHPQTLRQKDRGVGGARVRGLSQLWRAGAGFRALTDGANAHPGFGDARNLSGIEDRGVKRMRFAFSAPFVFGD
jgi:hypothetical protein